MNPQVNAAADRVARAADELMSHLSHLANVVRDATDFSVAYWEVVDPAVDIRKSLLRILGIVAGATHEQRHATTIHFAQLADQLEGSDQLYQRPADCAPIDSVSIL